jgi:hypothetical protein
MSKDPNGQKWKIVVVVGNNYNNNIFVIEEI